MAKYTIIRAGLHTSLGAGVTTFINTFISVAAYSNVDGFKRSLGDPHLNPDTLLICAIVIPITSLIAGIMPWWNVKISNKASFSDASMIGVVGVIQIILSSLMISAYGVNGGANSLFGPKTSNSTNGYPVANSTSSALVARKGSSGTYTPNPNYNAVNDDGFRTSWSDYYLATTGGLMFDGLLLILAAALFFHDAMRHRKTESKRTQDGESA